MLDDKTLPKPLLPRWINNILVIISTVVSTILALLVLVLLTKHFKIKPLLATLIKIMITACVRRALLEL